jgi:cytochrome b subunit of formate dehydrogenase
VSASSAATGRPAGGAAELALRWLPPLLFLVAVAGVIAVLPSIAGDEDGREWHRGVLGGSNLYKLNVVFARLVPFVAGASLALAASQRRWLRTRETHTATSLQRHALTEVLTHWLNAIGVVLCLITAVWLLGWFGNPVTLETAYTIHFLGAGFTLAAVCHHLGYQLFGGGSGLIPRSRADAKNALAETVSYAGVYRGLAGVFGIQLPPSVRRPVQTVLRRYDIAPDPAGKYLATEKVVSYSGWAIVVGVVVTTGVVKALNYVYGMPGGVLQAASFLHDNATYVLLVLLFLHIAALVLVPRNWPLLRSMFTTRVSRAYAAEHLPLWAEQEQPDRPST